LIFSSSSIFQISLNPAEIIIILLIHFKAISSKAFITNFAGIANTAISTTIGNPSTLL